MTWLAQVRHVLAKDFREHRWPLLAYVAVVAVATGRALEWRVFAGSAFGLAMVLVVLTGAFAAALAVQADSPTRSDAFWARHPLQPTAVAAAKLAFALLLLAIGLVGQAIAVRSYDVRGGELLSLVAGAAPVYGACLLPAMVVAAVLRDLRAFALAVVLVPLGTVIAFETAAPQALHTHAATLTLEAVGAVGGLALLVWLYRRRDARLRTRVAGFALAALTLPLIGALEPEAAEDVADVGNTPAAERVPLALERPDTSRAGPLAEGSRLRMFLRAAAVPPDLQLMLSHGAFVVRLRNGSVLRLPLESYFVELAPPRVTRPRLPGVRWIDSRVQRIEMRAGGPVATRSRDSSAFATEVAAPLTPEQRRAVDGGIAGIALEGRIVVRQAQVMTTIPLVVGTRVSKDGLRIHIVDWTHDFDEPAITIRTSTVSRDAERFRSAPWAWGPGATTYALVNAARGEGLLLYSTGYGASIDGLVVPGTRFASWTTQYRYVPTIRSAPGAGRSQPTVQDEAWLRDARLLVSSEVPRGSYPIRLELDTP